MAPMKFNPFHHVQQTAMQQSGMSDARGDATHGWRRAYHGFCGRQNTAASARHV
jgi:hypothetical protein